MTSTELPAASPDDISPPAIPVVGSFRMPMVFLGLGSLVLVAIVLFSTWLTGQTSSLTADLAGARQTRSAASQVMEMLLNAEIGQRGYILTSDDNYLTPYLQARESAAREMKYLKYTERNNSAIQPQIEELSKATSAKLAELEQTVALTLKGRRDEALAIVHTNKGKDLMDRARTILGIVIGDAEGNVSRDLDRLNANSRLVRIVTLLGGVAIASFAVAAFILLLQYIRVAVDARKEVEALNVTLEDRVLRRTEALTRANEEIQRFAYIVSHDLRAPLVNIMGFTQELDVGAQALREYFEDETEERKPAALDAVCAGLPEAVKFIRSSTDKMDRLINAILKLSREGRRELISEPVDLNKVFETILSSLKHQIDETETRVTITAPLPTLRSDRLSLEQIFGNIVDNALKYLQPGRPGELRITCETEARTVAILIADNGRGIAEQDQERVFELFRRAGRQDRPGEGIGLAHVRALVRRMGGDITVRSKLGEGSEFRVLLPRNFSLEQSSQRI